MNKYVSDYAGEFFAKRIVVPSKIDKPTTITVDQCGAYSKYGLLAIKHNRTEYVKATLFANDLANIYRVLNEQDVVVMEVEEYYVVPESGKEVEQRWGGTGPYYIDPETHETVDAGHIAKWERVVILNEGSRNFAKKKAKVKAEALKDAMDTRIRPWMYEEPIVVAIEDPESGSPYILVRMVPCDVNNSPANRYLAVMYNARFAEEEAECSDEVSSCYVSLSEEMDPNGLFCRRVVHDPGNNICWNNMELAMLYGTLTSDSE